LAIGLFLEGCFTESENSTLSSLGFSHGSLMLGQISVIEDHLKNHESNFVVAFVHGWRHDASIGDTNVRDARHYGAHVARFLADRCEKYKQIEFCGVTVTVVYIGWRGARVDERKLQQHFGVVGEWIGTMAAIPTLFDRKPVSEEVGPSTVTALRQLYNSMPEGHLKKMIVFGHSLGGNLLISTLKDYMVKMVGRHQSGRWIDDKPSNRRYRDLSRRQRPQVPHLKPRKCPQSAGYSSETGKHRFRIGLRGGGCSGHRTGLHNQIPC
jgi:hypothetical protein